MLKRAAGDAKEPVIIINADANATHQSVIHVMEAARAGRPRRTSRSRRRRPPARTREEVSAGGCRRSIDGLPRPPRRRVVCAARHRLAALLLPLSLLFGVAVARAARALSRAACCGSARVGVPVVVVGNITVGGAGKTPLVIALAEALAARGRHPGHREPRLRRQREQRARAVRARRRSGRRRRRAAAARRDRLSRCGSAATASPPRAGCSPRIRRATWCCATTACSTTGSRATSRSPSSTRRAGCGNGSLLPAGPLREPASRLDDVDAVVRLVAGATSARDARGDGRATFDDARAARAGATSRDRRARRRSRDAGATGSVHAVAGIGNPQRFFDLLARSASTAIAHAFPDHHALRRGRSRVPRRRRRS